MAVERGHMGATAESGPWLLSRQSFRSCDPPDGFLMGTPVSWGIFKKRRVGEAVFVSLKLVTAQLKSLKIVIDAENGDDP